MHASPDLGKPAASPDAVVQPEHTPNHSPTDMRAPRALSDDARDAPLATPPSMQMMRDPSLVQGMRNLSATPSDRGGDLATTPPASTFASQSLQSSPVHPGASPLAMRALGEPFVAQQVQAMSALGFKPNADATPLSRMSSAFSAFGMQPLASASPQALFVDPQSTHADSPQSPQASAESGVPAWSTLTPTMAATSLQLPLPISPPNNMSPTRRARAVASKAPRKTQSTPLFQITTMSGVETPPAPPVPGMTPPGRARGSQKVLRKHASNKRMSMGFGAALNTSPNDTKAGNGARLRARSSMMALRQANAIQAAAKPSPARRPMTLSFVNYGIQDAEELCSAVAPSGSYKVPLRGYSRDSEGDDDEPMGETKSARASGQANSAPANPPLRHAASVDEGTMSASHAPSTGIKRRGTSAVLRDRASQQE